MLIAQLEKLSGQSRDTSRYYERTGLITPPQRSDKGYRRYDQRALAELTFIAKAQQIGFTLQQIKPGLAHLHEPAGACDALIASLQAKGAEIKARMSEDRQRLARLNRMLKRLQTPA